jgi:uncharacterized membrane protein
MRDAKAEGWHLVPCFADMMVDSGGIRVQTSMSPEAAVQTGRWPALDAARGAAIAAMVVYHFAWDLSFLRLIATDVVGHPAWQLFARAIAASFLTLVGIGLVLAHHRGVRWRPFLRRLAVIAAAALGITAATRFAFPDAFIFFGILHCIAVSSILAVPFLRAPTIVLMGAAAFCFAAPLLFTDPALDAPLLDWLGLGARTPSTNDYVPIFPWFGFVLLGLQAGRLVLPWAARASSASSLASSPLSRGLIWSGRRSLAIYLVHQPLLFGALFCLVQITGPNPAAEDAHFERTCQRSCRQSGAETAICASGCACAAERLKAEGLWRKTLADGISAADQERLSSVTRQCFRSSNDSGKR